MAVTLIGAYQMWVGLAADAKPAAAPAGSRYHEADTGQTYIWDGANWQAITPAVGANGGQVVEGKAGGVAVASSDAGPATTTTRTTTISGDMTGGADLTAAPTAGQCIVIDDLFVSADFTGYLSLLEETSGTEIMRLYVASYSPVQVTPRAKLKLPTAAKKLRGDASGAGNIAVTVLYHTEAA